jgi:hypothetical protein
MDYLNPGLCQLQAISDFYEEVFEHNVPMANLKSRPPTTDKFMIFSSSFSLASDYWIEQWEKYRYGQWINNPLDNGLHRCNPLNFEYGVQPQDFLSSNVREENKDYLLTYEEECRDYDLWSAVAFKYEYQNKKAPVKFQNGITLREAFFLSLFEWWKNGRFTPRAECRDRVAIPCRGSICSDGDWDKKYWPIPIVILSENSLESTWASTKGHMPSPALVKIYTPKETVIL